MKEMMSTKRLKRNIENAQAFLELGRLQKLSGWVLEARQEDVDYWRERLEAKNQRFLERKATQTG